MRVVFFGTPAFAVPTLEALLEVRVDVAAVVTQPDRAQGRSRSTLVAPPVKQRAIAAGIAVLQPERPRSDEFIAAIRELDVDLGVVVAYGHLLPPSLLALPRLGMVNVHASLLPRWRGAAPIQWAILAGDAECGVSIMRVEEGLDSGGVWRSARTAIDEHDTTGTLFTRLANLGARTLLDALPQIAAGDAPMPQSTDGVTHAPKIDRDVARIDWRESASLVSQRIRAMDPTPGAWTTLGADEVKLFAPRPTPSPAASVPPGTITVSGHQLIVTCGGGAVAIDDVQPAGRRRMTSGDWLRGSGNAAGSRFE